MEHPGALRIVVEVLLPLLVENILEHLRQGDEATRFVLVGPAIEPHGSRVDVYAIPSEWEYLAPSPADVKSECHRGTQIVRQLCQDGCKLRWLEKTLPHVVLSKVWDMGGLFRNALC